MPLDPLRVLGQKIAKLVDKKSFLGYDVLGLTHKQKKVVEVLMENFNFDLPDFDLAGFNLELDGAKPRIENRYCLPKIYKHVPAHRVKYDRAEDLVAQMGDAIMAGERVNAILSGNFIFGDLIEALAVKQNLYIDNLTLSTLSMGRDNIDSLQNLIEGDYLGTLNIIVSDYFWSHNRQNAPYIYDRLDKDDNFQLAVAGTRTKITLIKTGEKKIVISGSANLRSSRSVEEIQIETNPDLYDFHMGWHKQILDNYGTIRKAVRAQKLFDMITKNTEGKPVWDQE